MTAQRRDVESIAAFVKDPKPPMPDLHPSPLDDEAVQAVASYVRGLQSGRKGSDTSAKRGGR